ncbi:AraC family transcriptional regulator [Leptothoe sp. LEGE 181152]|nr:AraC family transcriptional regulator [Leptothoe sp. LEGE 181152]
MDVITQEAYEQQWQDCLKVNGAVEYNTNGFDRVGHCQNRYSSDHFWSVRLQSGLQMDWFDDDNHQDLCRKTEHSDSMPFVAKFYLSGQHGVYCPGVPGVPPEYCEANGQSYFFALPDIEEDEISLAHERVQLIRLHIEPRFFQTFGMDLAFLPGLLQRTLTGEHLRFHQSLGKMSPAMHTVLQQILHCPYHHETKRLFLEGKALELLALQIDQWVALEQDERPSRNVKAADTERLYEAANILLKELTNPPSLITLARRVGLNEHKLKVGFRQIFKTTVFGYVRAQRLEQAKQLLLAGDITVTQAASAVGYASQGHFAAAFRKRFGVNPRSLRQ